MNWRWGEANQPNRFFQWPQMQPIAGVIEWGSAECWGHNRLPLCSLKRKREGATKVWEVELLLPGVDPDGLDYRSYVKQLRWFRYGDSHCWKANRSRGMVEPQVED